MGAARGGTLADGEGAGVQPAFGGDLDLSAPGWVSLGPLAVSSLPRRESPFPQMPPVFQFCDPAV